MLENLVFTHLLRLGFKTHIGQLDNKEVDFVAEKDGKTVYVQVAYLISDETTKDREFGNLLAIPDNYQKIVVSMDGFAGGEYKGIKHQRAMDFLLSESL
jgi:predicted AAA+ superfamily ATPase